MSQPMIFILLLLLVLLVWQSGRSRLSWRWRWLWLPVVLGIGGALVPPNLPREQQELVVLTPGDDSSALAARQWAQATGAALVAMSTSPDASQLRQLQEQIAANGGKRLHLFGYGFDAAVWQQLPRQTLIWHAPELSVWQLQAPESLLLGDALTLTLRAPATAQQLQLLDSRQQLQAESLFAAGSSTQAFRPAVSGHYDWTLRVRDSAGAVLRDIPLAFAVTAPAVRALTGHFSAPSFEQRALREWWQLTGWQGEFVTRTGQSVQRRDRFNLASHAAFTPQLQLRDVRSWLQASNAERKQLLQQVAAGQTLLLLSDGSESELRARTLLSQQLGLDWQALTEPEQALSVAGVTLQRASWLPRAQGPWQQAADRAVLQRRWQQGRIVWMGVINSHRLWQKTRSAYADWWQQALQLTAQARARWHSPGPGVPQQPALLCIDDLGIDDFGLDDPAAEKTIIDDRDVQHSAAAAATDRKILQLQTPAGERLQLPLQMASTPGQACALYTPRQSGWYQVLAPVTASWNVQASPSLPESLWQHAYAATRRHSQEAAPPLPRSPQPLPRWPFLMLSLLALAAIWWRERQLQSA